MSEDSKPAELDGDSKVTIMLLLKVSGFIVSFGTLALGGYISQTQSTASIKSEIQELKLETAVEMRGLGVEVKSLTGEVAKLASQGTDFVHEQSALASKLSTVQAELRAMEERLRRLENQ